MTYLLDLDQDQRVESYEAIEEIYLEGISDGFDGRLPMNAEIMYLQGYCEGMKQVKMIDLSINISASMLHEERTELPLVCGQCYYLNNGICSLKTVARNSNSYACPSLQIDCPF
ncbi:hypothetical protein [Nostoc sp.]|uniref:hypothetical protein n=1 Tax=Nostoc sp. TaxID=1180 RepID=UPI003593B4FA